MKVESPAKVSQFFKNPFSMKALQKPYSSFFGIFISFFLIISFSIDTKADCTDPWYIAFDLVDGNNCCISEVEVYAVDGDHYLWLPYDEVNCPLDGPQYNRLYDCQGNEICYTENLSGLTTCDDLGWFPDGSGYFIWQNSCTINPCIEPTLFNDTGCDAVYDPVCGCNGITYENECVAQNYGGVVSYTQGACEETSPCFELDMNANFIESYGTDDEPQSLAAEIYDFYPIVDDLGSFEFLWTFSNGFSSTEENLIGVELVTIENGIPQGPYEVCLTVTNTVLNCSETICEEISFGVVEGTGTIGNYVWFDDDADGVQDLGESNIPGVTVTLTYPDGTAGTTTTDGSGIYQFDDLPAGNYTVEVGNGPEGTALTTPSSYTITLEEGEDYNAADFGFADAGIGDYVFIDENEDSLQDVGEAPIEGVVVNLYLTSDLGNPIETTVTDATGFYDFTGLDPDNEYVVQFVIPNGFEITPQSGNASDGGVDDSDADENGFTDAIDLVPGEFDSTIDAGFIFIGDLGSIGDIVFNDLDADGVQDPGEEGIPGVTVTLTYPDGTSETTLTNGTGEYVFEDLPEGDSYTVTVGEGPDCSVLTTNASISVNLAEGEDYNAADFGFHCAELGSIGDLVFNDLDADGVQDPGEEGIPGVTVTLIYPDGSEETTTTDNEGEYIFDNLPEETYIVEVGNGPEGTYLTTQGSYSVNLGEGEDYVDADFGFDNYEYGSIGDFVFNDLNSNAIQEAGEPGIPGVVLTLTYPDGSMVTTVTDGNGDYEFDQLLEGVYAVEVGEGPDCAVLTTNVSISVNLAEGEDYNAADFGFHCAELGSIGDLVFKDPNENGIQDVIWEQGIEGVEVVLNDNAGNVIDVQLTDEDGQYLFDNLVAGTYLVEIMGYEDFELTTSSSFTIELAESEDYLAADFGVFFCPAQEVTIPPYFDLQIYADFCTNGIITISEVTSFSGSEITINDSPGTIPDYLLYSPLPGLTTDTLLVSGCNALGVCETLTIIVLPYEASDLEYNILPWETLNIDLNEIIENPNYTLTETTDPSFGTVEFSIDSIIYIPNDGFIGVDSLEYTLCTLDDFCTTGTIVINVDSTGSIGGVVFMDPNQNGSYAPSLEDAISGLIVTLIDSDSTIVTTMTDENGIYLFEDLPEDTYTVIVSDVSYYTITTQNTYILELAEGEDYSGADFGFANNLGAIGGIVFHDINQNGVQDLGEVGLEGLTIQLEESITTTDENGAYIFPNLFEGDYQVTILGVGFGGLWTLTTSNTYEVDLGMSVINTEINFGAESCIQIVNLFYPTTMTICPEFCQLGALEEIEYSSNPFEITSNNCFEYPIDSAWLDFLPSLPDDTLTIAACNPNTGLCEELIIVVSSIEMGYQAPNLDYTILPGEPLTINLNDFIENPAYSITDASESTFGTVNFSVYNVIDYVPDDDFIGVDVIEYTICSSAGDCSTGTIVINVESDVAPLLELEDDFYTVTIGESILICPLENDTYSGFVTINFTPATGLSDPTTDCPIFSASLEGINIINYTVCDEIGDCDDGTITILVEGISPVMAEDDYESTDLNTQVNIELLVNDEPVIEPSSGNYIIEIIEAPQNGTVEISIIEDCIGPECLIAIYTPNLNYEGTDQFVYSLCNGTTLPACSEASVYISVGVDCSEFCVWPGDTNNDGVANNFDLLNIGLLFGETGPERTNPSTEWTAQQSFDWEVEVVQANQDNTDSLVVNGKYADCDGSGLIENQDAFAITANYGLTHGKPFEEITSIQSPSITLSIQEEFIEPGTWVNVDIALEGNLGEDIEDLYGIAFQIDYFNEYEGEQVIVGDSVFANLGDSWINNQGNDLDLTLAQNLYELDNESTQMDIAIVRTNQIGVDGSGQIGTVSTLITQNITGKTDFEIPLNFYIKNAYILLENGQMLPLNNTFTETQVEVTTGLNEIPNEYLANMSLFPNPAKEQINLSILGVEIELVKIINLTGQTLKEFKMLNSDQLNFGVAELPDGIYYLHIQTNQGVLNRKIEIIHY